MGPVSISLEVSMFWKETSGRATEKEVNLTFLTMEFTLREGPHYDYLVTLSCRGYSNRKDRCCIS